MKNFAWIGTWKITRRCNLYCVYCDHKSMLPAAHRENIDYNKIIKNIRGYSPKILNISGGEPTLVKELPDILLEIKKQWNPFIRIVHNGTNPEKLLSCIENMDRLVISLDGPDPVNKATRGISAEKVFKNLKAVLPEFINRNKGVYFNCVLTTSNIKYMRQLAQEAKNLSPAITVSFTPFMPPDGDLSILQNEELFHEFLSTYKKLKKEGFSVMHVFDGIKQHTDLKHIQCYNQYFTIKISTEGHVLTCAMNSELNFGHFFYYFRKLLLKNGFSKAKNRIKKKFNQDYLRSMDFSCTTPCACENWLDLVFLGIKSDCISSYAKGLYGRMTESDYTNSEAFVREYINSQFNKEMLKNCIEASGDAK